MCKYLPKNAENLVLINSYLYQTRVLFLETESRLNYLDEGLQASEHRVDLWLQVIGLKEK